MADVRTIDAIMVRGLVSGRSEIRGWGDLLWVDIQSIVLEDYANQSYIVLGAGEGVKECMTYFRYRGAIWETGVIY